MYDFIGDLSESRLIPSKSNLRKFTAQEVADLAVLNLCALYILWSNTETKEFAEKYAKRTMAHGPSFDRWHTNGTDLYILVHALTTDEHKLARPEISDPFRANLPIGQTLLVRWLKDMMADRLKAPVHRSLFVKLDFNFRTTNNSIRAIRRLVMDWDKLTRRERELAMTRLLQFMRSRASRGELLAKLQEMARKHDLEIVDACDMETGEGCDSSPQQHHAPEKPKGSWLASLTGLAIGAGINTALHNRSGK